MNVMIACCIGVLSAPVATAGAQHGAPAADLTAMKRIPLHNGPNEIDSNGDGRKVRTIAVLRPTSGSVQPITVVIADRAFGKSFADEDKVKFVVYRLIPNNDQVPGQPLKYFEVERTLEANGKHIDVEEALASELGIASGN